jgi:lauroyl/myristoyl acyltransferase
MPTHKLFFTFILIFTWPIRWLPYRTIHRLGTILGTCAYYCLPKFRKRTLSNLALASSLRLTAEEVPPLAKASLQNLMITCLEYAKFASEQDIHQVVTCVNPQVADQLMQDKKPVIFFCGHQSNWEVLFLEGTKRMPGVAIGRPIKNKELYNWVLSIRQKYGGTIITPQNAIREGLRGLKRGAFLGIVGDQGMPDSGYCCPFLGRSAWTSPIAAILSHRTGSPIIVATTRRKDGQYYIHYSDPIWPQSEAPMNEEVDRLMRESLLKLEEKIQEEPAQWLWSHNRWKQQTPDKLKRRFRHESILIILPQEPKALEPLLPHLGTFRDIYPHEFLTIYAPSHAADKVIVSDAEVMSYLKEEDLLRRDYRFKLVFNFSSFAVKDHFKKLAAFEVVSLQDLYALTQTPLSFPETLKTALLKSHAS